MEHKTITVIKLLDAQLRNINGLESPHLDAATEQDRQADKADETVATAHLEEALTISRTSYSRYFIHNHGGTES